ncbi:MmcQ/YjbR family DNA-binding protein [Pedobacter sp. G11]|nr:MmcQ/YjbR family DNA-binding protein [Pedobacter sp. G11]
MLRHYIKTSIMISPDSFRALALSFEEVVETPNANKNSFKVDDKIFITVDNANLKAVFRLSPKDQSKFSDLDPSAIYPAQAGWGKQGWTIFELSFIESEVLENALRLSYCTVAPEELAKKYKKKTSKK